MKKAIILFSHTLTENQIQELKLKGCNEIVYLPEELQKKWSAVDEENNATEFEEYLKKIGNKNDLVLIQGEWGLTYKMINFSKKIDLIPIYAKTNREVVEDQIGESIKKVSYFRHLKFNEY